MAFDENWDNEGKNIIFLYVLFLKLENYILYTVRYTYLYECLISEEELIIVYAEKNTYFNLVLIFEIHF